MYSHVTCDRKAVFPENNTKIQILMYADNTVMYFSAPILK